MQPTINVTHGAQAGGDIVSQTGLWSAWAAGWHTASKVGCAVCNAHKPFMSLDCLALPCNNLSCTA